MNPPSPPVSKFSDWVPLSRPAGISGLGRIDNRTGPANHAGENARRDKVGGAESIRPKSNIVGSGPKQSAEPFTRMKPVARPGSEEPTDETHVC